MQEAKPETRVHARLFGIENLSLLLDSVLQSMVSHRFVAQWCVQSHDHGKLHTKNRTCNAQVDASVQFALPAARLSALRRLQTCCALISEAAFILSGQCLEAKLDLRLSFWISFAEGVRKAAHQDQGQYLIRAEAQLRKALGCLRGEARQQATKRFAQWLTSSRAKGWMCMRRWAKAEGKPPPINHL